MLLSSPGYMRDPTKLVGLSGLLVVPYLKVSFPSREQSSLRDSGRMHYQSCTEGNDYGNLLTYSFQEYCIGIVCA